MSTEVRPPSANERIKSDSRYLRGTIADGLTRSETGSLADDDQQLTKFHGIYLQDDRDLRPERGRQKMEKAFIFMARLRVPGGVLTPRQWLAAERVARERAAHGPAGAAYAWLRGRPPTAVLGGSIYVFDLTGDPDAIRRVRETPAR